MTQMFTGKKNTVALLLKNRCFHLKIEFPT